jgi:site-specific DNA recombinase
MNVAICARYSSDNQRDASIADQLRICREFAARQGWTVTQEFTDHAISGATLLRSGFQALMRNALNRRFDVVLAESLDRFSRDQEDTQASSSVSPSPASTSSRSPKATSRTCTSASRGR